MAAPAAPDTLVHQPKTLFVCALNTIVNSLQLKKAVSQVFDDIDTLPTPRDFKALIRGRFQVVFCEQIAEEGLPKDYADSLTYIKALRLPSDVKRRLLDRSRKAWGKRVAASLTRRDQTCTHCHSDSDGNVISYCELCRRLRAKNTTTVVNALLDASRAEFLAKLRDSLV
jgi:hypothetical protein